MKYKTFLTGVSATALLASSALARNFDISGGNLDAALTAYQAQSGATLMVPSDAVRNAQTAGVKGDIPPDQALILLLKGTGFGFSRDSSGVIAIVPKGRPSSDASDIRLQPMQLAQASPQRAAVETVTVTSSKLGGADVQSIPIAITALSQEQLTATQTAGGPDLVKQVPNLTFTKTNFSGYSIQIRGIGTQAISVTTDPAVAVAFNDMPFIRNHFFEQEFYDLSQAEVLRGPQGTLYGRNATAGVVNLITARPSDQFEAMASADVGNYHERRFEGMLNIPLVDDRFDLRVAGEWTKRQGYSFNELTNQRIDGRDLWSGRVTLGLKPLDNVQMHLVWEHFSENDDRIRSSKQLCKRDPGPSEIDGEPTAVGAGGLVGQAYLSQGCLPVSLYSPDAFGVVNGYSLPYYGGLVGAGAAASIRNPLSQNGGIDAYASVTQSRNLRVIESSIDPAYRVKNDTAQFEADYSPTQTISFVSQTGFNHDFLWSTQDYNRFNTQPGIFAYDPSHFGTLIAPGGKFCDPQLGCSDRLVAQDISAEHAWQLNQEFRLSSNFSGPLNFSVGANYMHYETEESYYVFINTLTMYAGVAKGGQGKTWVPGVSDNSSCLSSGFNYPDPAHPGNPLNACPYIDPNPFGSLNDNGHNYFLSQNPYLLDSYATFGEVNYKVTPDIKLVGGLRWTEDRKHFTEIPSEILTTGWGYPSTGVVNQQWDQITGRAAINWAPKLEFTDQTLVYGSYAHGYKAGGANPPGAVLLVLNKAIDEANPVHPLTFKPEFVDAFEVGTKNTLLDGALTFNGDAFYYNYRGYQISQIVDRTSVNLNFDAHVKGAEVEASWEPVPGLRFNFGGGFEHTRVADGSQAIDLMDRTAGHSDWVVVKPYVTQASNCVLPDYVVKYLLFVGGFQLPKACGYAYFADEDPLSLKPYNGPPGKSSNGRKIPDYPGFDPLAGTADDPYTGQNSYNGHDYGPAPNNGAGFEKDLSGNELPNAPHFTISAGAQYSMPLSSNWAGTLRGDFYWQDNSWARIFNDDPYDRIHGYTNLNLALIFTSQTGWQVMLYDKNAFNTTAITGAFLNSDDTGLTTNVFLTDPKLIGVRITKNW